MLQEIAASENAWEVVFLKLERERFVSVA